MAESSVVTNSETALTNNLVDQVYLQELRQQMLKFATIHLRDEFLAEDAVQEALIGALKNAGSFARQAALKTWVFAILKNKITDILRQNQRMGLNAPELAADDVDADAHADMLFDGKGHWALGQNPASWSEPLETVKNEHFWRVFDACLNKLPEKQARLFMMREFLEFTSAEICSTLDLSTSNLHVMLYRARLGLRECLENNWFVKGE